MIAIALILICAGLLIGALGLAGELRRGGMLPRIILGGFVLRVVMSTFMREIPFFSYGAGGDCTTYEQWGITIAAMWQRDGFQYITSERFPPIGATSLPPNMFGLVTYLNGGDPSRVGCTALIALAAGLTALNLYALAVQFGAERKTALLFSAIIYFQPAFLFYTSDMFKDGLVLVLTLGALGSALRLGYRFTILHAFVGIVCLWALWYVRFYLVFVTFGALVVGVVGVARGGFLRSLIAVLVFATIAVGLAGLTDILQLASERATVTFEHGTSQAALIDNAQGGSGVLFDDGGSPYNALPAKLAYTMFSPFPWSAGSMGFQLGKLDAFLWYFIFYRAVRGARQADPRLLVMLLTFIVPCTLMYAMSMSNIGLIVRQRLVVVAAMTILAAIYKPKTVPRPASAKARSDLRRGRLIPPRLRTS